jgi:tetratricopeptide (TPR) repeat protein
MVRIFLGMTIAVCLGVSTLSAQEQPPQAQQKEKKVKDQGEWEIFNAVVKETDPKKKLALLNTWRDKYPQTDYADERLVHYLVTYQQLGQPAQMIEIAKQMLARDPKNIQAMATIVALTPTLNVTTPEALDLGDKAAKGVLDAPKPATTGETEWNNLKVLAHKTLGWTAMQRKNNDVAEQHFKEALKMNPNSGVISYWLATVVRSKPEKQSEALYHFARAAVYEGADALPPAGRQQVETYLTKAYTTFHGKDEKGLEELKSMAKSSAIPPEGFKIKTAAEIAFENEEKLREENPQLYLWMTLKRQLTAAEGQQYFESNMKGTQVPKLKGKLIEHRPAGKPTELVLGISDENTPEVTLKLDSPLAGKAEPGTEIEFEGVPTAFAKEPLMVTFDVEKDKLSGWPVQATTKKSSGKKTGRKK